MSNVLTQAFVYLLLLGVGYGFKRAGIFRVEDSAFLKSVILYITMPATAVNGLKDLELQPSFLWCFLTGFVTCTVLMAAGLAVARNAPRAAQTRLPVQHQQLQRRQFCDPVPHRPDLHRRLCRPVSV